MLKLPRYIPGLQRCGPASSEAFFDVVKYSEIGGLWCSRPVVELGQAARCVQIAVVFWIGVNDARVSLARVEKK